MASGTQGDQILFGIIAALATKFPVVSRFDLVPRIGISSHRDAVDVLRFPRPRDAFDDGSE
jgi:hypothetical protein